jgi:hypothetical protein
LHSRRNFNGMKPHNFSSLNMERAPLQHSQFHLSFPR